MLTRPIRQIYSSEQISAMPSQASNSKFFANYESRLSVALFCDVMYLSSLKPIFLDTFAICHVLPIIASKSVRRLSTFWSLVPGVWHFFLSFDSIRLFSHILFILCLQFSTRGLAPGTRILFFADLPHK